MLTWAVAWFLVKIKCTNTALLLFSMMLDILIMAMLADALKR